MDRSGRHKVSTVDRGLRGSRWLVSLLGAGLLVGPGLAIAQAPPVKESVTIVDRSAFSREREVRRQIEAAEAILSSPFGRTASDFERARALLDSAIQVDPERAETYFLVAQTTLRYFGDKRSAEHFLEQFLDLAPANHRDAADVHQLLGELAFGEFTAASETAAAAGLAEKAERQLLAAYDAYTREGRSWAMASAEHPLAMLALYRNDLEGALRYLRAAMEHGYPEWFRLKRSEVYILISLKRPEEAERVLDEVLRSSAGQLDLIEHEELLFAQATVQRALGNYQAALQYLEVLERTYADLQVQLAGSGSQLSPLVARLYDETGATYFEMGDLDQAERYYRKAYDQSPSEPIHMNNLAWILVVRSEHDDASLDEALALAEEAVSLDPKESYLDTLAEVYGRLGRAREALALIEQALEVRPDWPYLKRQKARFEGELSGFPVPTGGVHGLKQWLPPIGNVEL